MLYKFVTSNIYIKCRCLIYVQIPGDMVVNSIIVAMVTHTNQPCEKIYQVGSSLRNPLKLFDICCFFYKYFHENPWISEDGNAVKFNRPILLFNSTAVFHGYLVVRYMLPLREGSWRSSINYTLELDKTHSSNYI